MSKGLLLLVAGIKGAIGTTLAVAVQALKQNPGAVLPYLMTARKLTPLGDPAQIELAGWDCSQQTMTEAVADHHVLGDTSWKPYASALDAVATTQPPDQHIGLADQIRQIKNRLREFHAAFPDHQPVFVNLLPAGRCHDWHACTSLEKLLKHDEPMVIPDLAYVIAAIESGLPVVNFTPNEVEIPAVIQAARDHGVPLAGRDGKTGQTYFKVVLASALRVRHLLVNGWYSANILGNADGENLMDPERAACKLTNKTDVLENVLGYSPGQKRFGTSVHKVVIDYYPPRGDAKEAWDVVDFEGVLGLTMSLRLNLLGRDSILAAPMILDLVRWTAALKRTGTAGPIPELAFYFKANIDGSAPHTFEEQLTALEKLEQKIDSA